MDEDTKLYLNSTSVQDEDAILSSPKGSTSSKSPENPSETSAGSGLTGAVQQKKVVLKRKLLTSVSLTESEPLKNISSSSSTRCTITAGNTESKVMKLGESTSAAAGNDNADDSKDSNGNADGNVVKLSQLSMKERLEMRAKKFGAPVTGDVAKLARAERFGLATADASASASGSVSVKSAADVELLKKRADRFGGSVSNTMVKIEMNEKLLKRQERFGAAAAATATTTTKPTTIVSGKVESKPISTQAASAYAEKAKLRLERFKTTA